ncbi:hypothetical protein BU26DRAFT_286957 [Trematosphaeria pertusa]|uniref:Uncharacterized protein n=1 Tax=Trematosphaeria pertusa TaxID=390896 RepID=A0A6A6IGC9_9PLEO|nr:uncharacterized protein BU26DRAFT_286957 [Trematosphaeria pertusa]KAF2249644.1 hypothetical protein BU26DRAFT_286957 [Trematosphaeria pertusa]
MWRVHGFHDVVVAMRGDAQAGRRLRHAISNNGRPKRKTNYAMRLKTSAETQGLWHLPAVCPLGSITRMPVRKAEKKVAILTPGAAHRTGDYSNVFAPPQPYKPIRTEAPIQRTFLPGNLPSISTHDVGYFFNLAASLYSDHAPPSTSGVTPTYAAAPPPFDAPPGYTTEPPDYAEEFRRTAADVAAVLVMRLFRQTRIDIFPIAERFHLGPADRQPLYSLNAQPSIRSGTEFNELAIRRRDPVTGSWYSVCTSDIEPSLDLVKPGNWTVAKLVLDSMPVWKKIVAGCAVPEATVTGKGNSLRLSWGDRQTLGALGNAYGLWWDNGVDQGRAEAFYVVEGWTGFDSRPQGVVRVKPGTRDANGRYQDPRRAPYDLAAIYFHSDGKTPPQFVCANPETHVRMDVIMAGLMTVLVVETRKVAVVKELGSLPSYDSDAHWSSTFVEEGVDLGDAWGT